jgi:hypothetical protein
MRFASTGFHSQEARGIFILQNIENQECHCDYWLYWWIGLMLFMEFAQDATWWFSPLHRMTAKKGVLQYEVCQHWISLTVGKRDLYSAKYWNQCCHCDFWMHWWIGLRLFMEFAQDATWWFSPLYRMTAKKGVLQHEVCQHWISLTGGKRDLFSFKILKINVVIVIINCVDG